MYEIFCYDSQIENLDLTGFRGLHTLECYNTNIKTLDISGNPELVGLNCSNTNISSLDLSKNTKLQRLECADTPITYLDISNNSQLRILNITQTNITNLRNLDMSSYPNLEELYCANAGLESLNVGNNPNLYSLTCEGNSLTSLDLSKTGELWYEKKVSPQARIVFANVQEECMVFDMKTIVPELGKVSLPAGEGYIYDNSSGLLTVNGLEEKNITFLYDHGYTYEGLEPMEVTLLIREKADISDEGNDQKEPLNPVRTDTDNRNPDAPDKIKAAKTGDGVAYFTWLSTGVLSFVAGAWVFHKKIRGI